MSFNLNLDIIVGYENDGPPRGPRLPLSAKFSTDDRFMQRTLGTLRLAHFDGEKFEGSLVDLEPGFGYEVFVANDVTFSYDIYNRSADRL